MRSLSRFRFAAVAAFLLAMFSTATTQADEHYFVLIFGSQSSPKTLRRSAHLGDVREGRGRGAGPLDLRP